MEAFFSSLEAEVDVPLLEANKVTAQTQGVDMELGQGPGSKVAVEVQGNDEERLKAIMKARKGKEVEKVPANVPAGIVSKSPFPLSLILFSTDKCITRREEEICRINSNEKGRWKYFEMEHKATRTFSYNSSYICSYSLNTDSFIIFDSYWC